MSPFLAVRAVKKVIRVTTMDLQSSLKAVLDGSTTMVTWALAVGAGSVAAIVSTSYIRPENKSMRAMYLLFLPGWFLLGISVYFGNRVASGYMAAQFVNDETIKAIAHNMNHAYDIQQTMLATGLLVFGIWLVIFLVWWVAGNWSVERSGR